ncbi:MAG: pantoate--beta-alanine ligase [Magnetococcales bacterium]|nr:pantoate--beta-alanine ligase [Magnetococcales bacterium]
MELLNDLPSLRAWVAARELARERIGFVPTMGALHAGHLSLVRQARLRCDRVVASIFVNPTQFGPNEDFARYPRTLEADQALLAGEGCDALFLPDAGMIYPEGFTTRVSVGSLGEDLCGRSRPGHFDGVALVVTILFHLVRPAAAFFGLKDYQQFVVIRRLARDLAMPVEVVGLPTVREADGLAMSSRNRYLAPGERERAASLSRALLAARERLRAGERDPAVLEEEALRVLREGGVTEVEYVAVREAETLAPMERVSGEPVMLLAARVGRARLIDNMVLSLA